VNEAIPYLVDSLTANPIGVDTLCSLAFCYSEMNALDLAEESARKAIAVRGAYARAHLLLGIVRFKQNRLDEAEAEVRRAIELERVREGFFLDHYYLGNVLHAKGNIEGARREYQLELRNDHSIDPAAAAAQKQLEEIEKQQRAEVRR
jgi:tetratricopeptide (TPR) repeat protein